MTDEHPGHPAGANARPDGEPPAGGRPQGLGQSAARPEEHRARSAAPPHRRAAPDPLGKRALFWVPAPQPAPAGRGGRIAGKAPLGKRALYSGAPAAAGTEEAVPADNPMVERGPITVTCSACGAVTRVGVLDFLIYQLPLGIWLPRGRFDHRMTCPSCRRRVWAGVTLRRE